MSAIQEHAEGARHFMGVRPAMPWIVSVTYGKRRHFLLQMIRGGREQQVKRFVIVNNGADWDLNELKVIHPDLAFDIVEMGSNKGSAGGYAAGIRHAVNSGAEFIWLMDDDNRPKDQCLQTLIEVYERESVTTARDRLAVLAFRSEHQGDVADDFAPQRAGARADSFRGFHVLDIPYKVWRRTPWAKPKPIGLGSSTILLQEAPYSGVLFHRDLIQAIGLPDPDFVLYADDYEFTHRIVRQHGGRIVLVVAAQQDDLESSWNTRGRFDNAFAANLCGAGDFRAYYGMRNGVYYDTISRKHTPVVFWLNCIAYMSLLFVFSRRYRRPERFLLLWDAVRDGLAGRLGMNERYPL